MYLSSGPQAHSYTYHYLANFAEILVLILQSSQNLLFYTNYLGVKLTDLPWLLEPFVGYASAKLTHIFFSSCEYHD